MARRGRRQPPDTPQALRRFREYHRIVTEFGKEALGNSNLDALLQHATECVSRGMSIRRAKVLEYRPQTDDLLVRNGVGWNPGVVGHAALPTDMASPPGRAFRAGEAVYIDDLPQSDEFEYSQLLRDHAIVSLVNVPITVDNRTWGVFEVDSEEEYHFNEDDEDFLAGFAAILGRAIESKRREAADSAAHMERTVQLRERDVLFRELQHRVANELQAIVGLLEVGRRRVSDPVARQQLDSMLDRATGILFAHEQLSLPAVERDISVGFYLAELAANLRAPDNIRIVRDIQNATVPLGTAVRLGIILNELVTNALKHAFGEDGGTISISFAADPESGQGRLVVADNGRGAGASPGRGSGTALVASFVEQIGGTLARSGDGKGMTVVITFLLGA